MTRWTVECPTCGVHSTDVYRCSECGKDLVDEDSETTGMEVPR